MPMTRRDLYADGQLFFCETAGNADHRDLGKVQRVGKAREEPGCFDTFALLDHRCAQTTRRGKQNVVASKDVLHPSLPLTLRLARERVLRSRYPRPATQTGHNILAEILRPLCPS